MKKVLLFAAVLAVGLTFAPKNAKAHTTDSDTVKTENKAECPFAKHDGLFSGISLADGALTQQNKPIFDKNALLLPNTNVIK